MHLRAGGGTYWSHLPGSPVNRSAPPVVSRDGSGLEPSITTHDAIKFIYLLCRNWHVPLLFWLGPSTVQKAAQLFGKASTAKLSTYVYNGGSNLRDSCRVELLLLPQMPDERPASDQRRDEPPPTHTPHV